MDNAMELSFESMGLLFTSAFLVGFSKTSVGGLGIIVVLLMALVFPGKSSPGVLLPMLVVADVFAVIFYRHDCQWKIIMKIFPLTAFGVVIGYFIVDMISQEVFHFTLGFIILSMLGLGILLEKIHVPSFQNPICNTIFTIIIGTLAGIATMLANAAGPLLAIYFLQLGLPKTTFVGTRSWYFLLLNLYKVPFSANLGLITWESLKWNLICLPVILLGAFAGLQFLKKINMVVFKWLIRGAALIVSMKLIY